LSASAGRTVWLSGRFLPEARARVSATGLTLTSGVGLYETLRLVEGVAPLAELHLARLRASCEALGLRARRHDWPRILAELAGHNRIRNGRARIIVGDGFELATCSRLPRGLASERKQGIYLTSASFERSAASLKATSRLALWLAERSSGGEVLLMSSRGRLIETTRANLFVITERGLETAPSSQALPGIARQVILELAREMGIPIRVRAPSLRERSRWREVFVSNALRGIRPVRRIDALTFPVRDGASLTRRLQRSLDERMGLS